MSSYLLLILLFLLRQRESLLLLEKTQLIAMTFRLSALGPILILISSYLVLSVQDLSETEAKYFPHVPTGKKGHMFIMFGKVFL